MNYVATARIEGLRAAGCGDAVRAQVLRPASPGGAHIHALRRCCTAIASQTGLIRLTAEAMSAVCMYASYGHDLLRVQVYLYGLGMHYPAASCFPS